MKTKEEAAIELHRLFNEARDNLLPFLDPVIGLKIYCTYTTQDMWINPRVTRCYATMSQAEARYQDKIVFDWPVKFLEGGVDYPVDRRVFTSILTRYIKKEKEELFTLTDPFHLSSIFVCADKRVMREDKNELLALILTSSCRHKEVCIEILNRRFP